MSEFYLGYYVELDEPPCEEEVSDAKKIIVDLLCDEIKRLAKEEPEQFFIVKRPDKNPLVSKMTVGAKLIAPTVKINK